MFQSNIIELHDRQRGCNCMKLLPTCNYILIAQHQVSRHLKLLNLLYSRSLLGQPPGYTNGCQSKKVIKCNPLWKNNDVSDAVVLVD